MILCKLISCLCSVLLGRDITTIINSHHLQPIMYKGHLANALLFKAFCGPSIPTWPIMFGACLGDIFIALDVAIDLVLPSEDDLDHPADTSWLHFLRWLLIWSVTIGGGWYYDQHARVGAWLLGLVSWAFQTVTDLTLFALTGIALMELGDVVFERMLSERYPWQFWVLGSIHLLVLSLVATGITRRRSGADTSITLVWMVGLVVLMSPWLSPGVLLDHLRQRGLLTQRKVLEALEVAINLVETLGPAIILSRIVDGKEGEARELQKRV